MKSEERLDSGYLVIARNRRNKQMGLSTLRIWKEGTRQ